MGGPYVVNCAFDGRNVGSRYSSHAHRRCKKTTTAAPFSRTTMYTTPRTNAATNEQIYGEMTYDAVSKGDKNEDDIFCTCPQTHTSGNRFSASRRHTPKEIKNTIPPPLFFPLFWLDGLAYSPGKQLSERQTTASTSTLLRTERIGEMPPSNSER